MSTTWWTYSKYFTCINWWGGNLFLPSAGEGSVLYLHRWNMLDQLLIVNLHKFLKLISIRNIYSKYAHKKFLQRTKGGWLMEPLYTMGDPLNLRFGRYPMSNDDSKTCVLVYVYSLYFNSTFLQGYKKGLFIYCCKAKK